MGVACARPLTARRGRSPGPSPCPAHVGLTGECQNPVECFKGVSLANTNDAALRGGRQSVGVLGVVNIYTYRRHTGPVSCIYPHGLLPSSCACCFLPPSSHAAWSDGHRAPRPYTRRRTGAPTFTIPVLLPPGTALLSCGGHSRRRYTSTGATFTPDPRETYIK